MDVWEGLINNFGSFKDSKSFSELLACARRVLTEDLADFEIESFVSTLLEKPVYLLAEITRRRTADGWASAIADSLRLLADMTEKHATLHKYYPQIVQMCMVGFEGASRQPALSCILQVSKHSAIGASHFEQHLAALEEGSTCRAPLALLIGTICSHHPHLVAEKVPTVWRVFLNVLDNKKLTSTARAAALTGAGGVLTSFGRELPTRELHAFYEHLRAPADLPRCQLACARLLSEHASLFRERVDGDASLRARLWDLVAGPHDSALVIAAQGALCAVYEQIALVKGTHSQREMEAEVLLRAAGPPGASKLTALRAMRALQGSLAGPNSPQPLDYVDLPALECRLTDEYVHYDDASLIAWAVESGVPGGRELVRAWLLRPAPLPVFGARLLARAVLDSPPSLLKWTVRLLVRESGRASRTDRCVARWRDLSACGRRSAELLALLASEVLVALREDATLGDLDEKTNEAIEGVSALVLCALTEGILESAAAEGAAARLATSLAYCVERYAAVLPAALAASVLAPDTPLARPLCGLRIEHVTDERAQWRCCTVLCSRGLAPPHAELATLALGAAQIILNGTCADATLLGACVRTVEDLGRTHQPSLDGEALRRVYALVVGLSARRGSSRRCDRELRREVLRFLNENRRDECWQAPEAGGTETVEGEAAVAELHDILAVSLRVVGASASQMSVAAALWAAASASVGSGLARESAQALVAWLADKLASCAWPPLPPHVLAWLARAGADLRPLAPLLWHGSLSPLLCWIETESDATTRHGLLVMMEVAEDGERVRLLRDILSRIECIPLPKYATANGRVELVETAVRGLRHDDAACAEMLPGLLGSALVLGSRAFLATAHLFGDRLPLFEPARLAAIAADLAAALLAVPPEHERTFEAPDRSCIDLLRSISSYIKNDVDVSDVLLDAIDDASDTGRVLSVFNELSTDASRPASGRALCLARDSLVPRLLFAVDDWRAAPLSSVDAAFQFIARNADTLMEIDCERTIRSLCALIRHMRVDHARHLRGRIAACLAAGVGTTGVLDRTLAALNEWLLDLRLWDVTESLKRLEFPREHRAAVGAVRDMLRAFGVTDARSLDVLRHEARPLAEAVRALHSSAPAPLQSYAPHLEEALAVALAALTDNETITLLEGNPDCEEFCRWGRSVLSTRLEHAAPSLSPRVLRTLLPDLLQRGALGTLADQAWTEYERCSSFEERLRTVAATCCEWDAGEGAAPRWVARATQLPETPLYDRLRLLESLPADLCRSVDWSAALTGGGVAGGERFTELRPRGAACVRALLVALARAPHSTLFDLVTTLADDESEAGWWDAAMERCMAEVAAGDAGVARELLTRAFERTREARTLGVCRRLLSPLLRYANPVLCEEAVAPWLPRLLSTLRMRPRVSSDRRGIRRSLLDYVCALTVLAIVFEKVDRAHIECPDSKLYGALERPSRPFHLVRVVCELCVTLREWVGPSPDATDDRLTELSRVFQCANFACLTAALRCRRGPPQTYGAVLDARVWERLAHNRDVVFPPLAIQRESTPHRPGHDPEEGAEYDVAPSSRVFLGSLGDDPLPYDLHDGLQPEASEEADDVDESSGGGDPDSHGCADALTALLKHVAARGFPTELYMRPLCEVLTGVYHHNLKWLLAQVVCDAKVLSGAELRDALISCTLDTLEDGRMNRLHLRILMTVLEMDGLPTVDAERGARVVGALVRMALGLGPGLPRSLTVVLQRWSQALGPGVPLSGESFHKYFEEIKLSKRPRSLAVLKLLSRCGLRVEGSVAALLEVARVVDDARALPELAEALGGVLAAATPDEAARGVLELRQLAHSRRNDAAAYLTLLANAARLHPALVDETHARIVGDMLTKIVGREKRKCIQILRSFVKFTNERGDERRKELIADVLESVLPLLQLDSDALAVDLCAVGIRHMRPATRRRVVAHAERIAGSSPSPAVRRAAHLLLFEYIKECIGSNEATVPPAKRLAAGDDALESTVFRRAFAALSHADEELATAAEEALASAPSPKDHFARLREVGSWPVLRLLLRPGRLDHGGVEESALRALMQTARGDETVASALLAAIPSECHRKLAVSDKA